MKKYENPMLLIVSINHNDIVTASPTTLEMGGILGSGTFQAGSAGRRFDEWYEGY